MSRVIFVTGGVISGIGKGVISASVGALLKEMGYTVSVLKFDPYLNVDPGVLSPYEHGEVFVTEDGLETDLDLGHYERFLNQSLSRLSNMTSGKIFTKIMLQERCGFFEGKTVQTVPHFTNEVKNWIDKVIQTERSDFLICEIGGTVGDIESNPYLLAIGQFATAKNNDTFLLHITYLPFLSTTKEFKTKPTQFSLNLLRANGLQPNILLLRSENKPPTRILKKMANYSGLEKEQVVALENIKQIYSCPLVLENLGIAKQLSDFFNLPVQNLKWSEWKQFLKKEISTTSTVKLALIAKYIGYPDAYKSILESLQIAAVYLGTNLELVWLNAQELIDFSLIENNLKTVDGVVILPGFDLRGFEGKVSSAQYLQTQKIPVLGLCLGFQAMVVAQARLCGIKNANSSEFKQEGTQQTFVLDLIGGKDPAIQGQGASLRLGAESIVFSPTSKIAELYKTTIVSERHRHRYNVVKEFVPHLERGGFVFSGWSKESGLIESCELINHPFYLGVQYHPEFKSRLFNPHPLFSGFLKAVLKFHSSKTSLNSVAL